MDKKYFEKHAIKIEKLVAEFEVENFSIFPWGKCKIKIYEQSPHNFRGITDILIKKKDNHRLLYPEGIGSGVDETLENTLKSLIEYSKSYQYRLDEKDIDYRPPYEF